VYCVIIVVTTIITQYTVCGDCASALVIDPVKIFPTTPNLVVVSDTVCAHVGPKSVGDAGPRPLRWGRG